MNFGTAYRTVPSWKSSRALSAISSHSRSDVMAPTDAAPSSTGDRHCSVREDETAWAVRDLAERGCLALVVPWLRHTTSIGVDADGATPCAEDAGGVAAAQDAPGLNAERVGSTWGDKSLPRGRLARPDANPITLWIAVEEKAHFDVRAVVGVRGELRLKPFPFYGGKCHLRYLWAFFAGGGLTVRHLDVLIEVHREGWCRERDSGHTDASD